MAKGLIDHLAREDPVDDSREENLRRAWSSKHDSNCSRKVGSQMGSVILDGVDQRISSKIVRSPKRYSEDILELPRPHDSYYIISLPKLQPITAISAAPSRQPHPRRR